MSGRYSEIQSRRSLSPRERRPDQLVAEFNWWSVVHPNPLPSCPGFGLARQLSNELLAHSRAIPPRADGEKNVGDDESVAVTRNLETANVLDPSGDLLASFRPEIEIMIA